MIHRPTVRDIIRIAEKTGKLPPMAGGALQASGFFIYPNRLYSIGETALLIDASGEKVAFILRVGKAGDLAKFHFRLGTVTTGQTLKGSFQDVDLATGDPDGTIDQSGTVAVADTDDNVWKTITMGANRTVVKGELLACVIEFDAAVGNLNILASTTVPTTENNAYGDLYTTLWAKSRMPLIALEYSDGSFAEIRGVTPALSSAITTFNTGSSPDEIGIKFKVPGPVIAAGAEFYGRILADTDLVLYDSDGSTVLGTVSIDKDTGLLGGTNDVVSSGFFSAVANLLANTWYTLAVKPTTTSNIRLYEWVSNVAAWLDQMSGGQNVIKRSRTDAGAWTDDATRRPVVNLICQGIDDGVGGGGGVQGVSAFKGAIAP